MTSGRILAPLDVQLSLPFHRVDIKAGNDLYEAGATSENAGTSTATANNSKAMTQAGAVAGASAKVLLLDIDDTMYINGWITTEKMTSNINDYIKKRFGLENSNHLYHKYGTTIRGLREEGYIKSEAELDEYLEAVHTFPNMADTMPRNEAFRAALLRLNCPVFAFTASIVPHAKRCMTNIGVLDIIGKRPIIDSKAVGMTTKYQQETYAKALKIVADNLGYVPDPKDVIFVDDNEKNLIAARKYGIGTLVLMGEKGHRGDTRKVCEHVDHILERIEDLPQILPQLFD